ncbi:MAG: carbamoyltransferase, partial [Hyphomicrobiaceae bacterium]
SPFEEAAVMTLDGVGEWATASWGTGRGSKLELTHELRFPHSLGLLYSAMTYFCGFRVNSGEYKLMGLAPYGEPKYVDLIFDNLVDVKEDGSFRMDLSYFNYCQGLTMTSAKMETLFGRPARKAETPITQDDMDIAASIQKVTEDIMLRMAHHVHRTTGMKNLCLAGGVALNCVGNGRILREGPFENVWIQPAAGDAGGALGAALFVWHELLENPRTVGAGDSQYGSLLGPSYATEEITNFLDEKGAVYHVFDDDEGLCDRVAELLADEKVAGWFQGRMEFGPRALGARSIVGDPRSRDMQTVMNLKIKFRESFRPFAPSVLSNRVADWFELRPEQESPYMLLVAPVREDKRIELNGEDAGLFGLDKLKVPRSEVPAVTHVDYSARVQTVDGVDNPRYRGLLERFEARTGCPVLINTSFNVRGEPIVCTPSDAYRCFLGTNMDVLVLENVVVLKSEQPGLEEIDVELYLSQFALD